jgi:hypothetical protein
MSSSCDDFAPEYAFFKICEAKTAFGKLQLWIQEILKVGFGEGFPMRVAAERC